MDVGLVFVAITIVIAGGLQVVFPQECSEIGRSFLAGLNMERSTPEIFFSVGWTRLWGVFGLIFGVVLFVIGLIG
jgi:hypothetical protein